MQKFQCKPPWVAKKNQRTLIVLAAALLLPLCGWAQAVRGVSGTVRDAENQALPGVSVVVKGTTSGVTTDASGAYTIQAPDNATLVFSLTGMTSKEEAVGGRAVVDVALAERQQGLDEVVVIGYGTVKKRDLTGAVSSVKGDQLASFPVSSLVESLQGRVAGADITRDDGYAGAGVTIRIRGNRSVNNPSSSNNPLYIVDGVQGVEVNDVNANDILSIEILKDAASTAIYGSRGANGVIIITTKKGLISRPKISLNSYFGLSQVAGYGDFMNAEQYIAFRREKYRAAGKWSSPADDAVAFTQEELDAIALGTDNNWPQLSLHQGYQQDHVLSVAAGTENTKVYLSGNIFDEQGILKNDHYTRYSGRMSVDQKVYSWLDAGMQAQLAYIDNQRRRDPFSGASKIYPIAPVYDENGNLTIKPFNGQINPLLDEDLNNYNQKVEATRFSGSAYLEIKPLKDLSLRSSFGATVSNSTDGSYKSKTSIDGGNNNASISQTRVDTRFFTWENVLSYSKTIGQHSFGLTGVASMNKYTTSNLWASARNPVLPAQLWYTMASTDTQSKGAGYSEYALASFAGRINYSFMDRYILNATVRADGSSKVGGKWASFPSVGLAWRVIEESFMKSQDIASNLKLRASYGVSGNDAVTPYSTQMTLASLANYSWVGSAAASTYVLGAKMGNTDLTWETTKSLDIGIDLGFFNDRLNLTFDYYNANTDNLLFNFPLPPTTGLMPALAVLPTATSSPGTIDRNYGKTNNHGVEILVESRNIVKKNFQWSTALTFAKNTEEIISLPDGKDKIDADYRNSQIIGQPAKVFYSFINDGIWQESEVVEAATWGAVPGDLKLRDISGPNGTPDGIIDALDRTVIGKVAPDFYGSINNEFKFYGFDLSIFMTYRVGSWITSDYWAKYNAGSGHNNGAVVDYWTPENPTGTFPRPNVDRTLKNEYLSMLSLRENSYFKVKNIVLGYTLPTSLSQRFKVENLRVWASIKNSIIISQEPNVFDPEQEGQIDQPLNKMITFGINIGL
jgi:TonB-linked SusC/RagA family outer membrane protein